MKKKEKKKNSEYMLADSCNPNFFSLFSFLFFSFLF